MHFIFFHFFTATVVASLSEDLFTSEESPENLFPSEISSESENSFLDHNGDLFVESTYPTDVSSSVDGTDTFELEASCLSSDGQLPTNLQPRDGACAHSDQPSLDDFINNALGIFGDPSDREEGLASTKTHSGIDCYPDFPVHLCCESEGQYIGEVAALNSFDVFDTMNNCEPGT